METAFTPIASLLGGGLIGLSAIIFMATVGRITGISGIVSRALPPDTLSMSNRSGLAFIAGLLLAAPVYALTTGAMPVQHISGNIVVLAVAGLLVGFGSVTGNGCTSGHGVCGLSRLSTRSLAATLTFILTAFVTVLVVRHLLEG